MIKIDKTKIGERYKTQSGSYVKDQAGILHNLKNLRFMMFRDRMELFGDFEGKTKLITNNVYKEE